MSHKLHRGPVKTNMTMEKQPSEDVCLIKDWRCSIAMLVSGGWKNHSWFSMIFHDFQISLYPNLRSSVVTKRCSIFQSCELWAGIPLLPLSKGKYIAVQRRTFSFGIVELVKLLQLVFLRWTVQWFHMFSTFLIAFFNSLLDFFPGFSPSTFVCQITA